MKPEKNKLTTKKKILVVVDMQNDFVSGALGNEMTQAVVPKIVKKLTGHSNKYDVIYFTRDSHFENYSETLEGKKLPIPHCIKDTAGRNIVKEIWDVIKELRKSKKFVRIVDKHTFASKELIDYLSATCRENDEIEFCGVCTDICVVSNAIALRAELPNNVIKVDARCCAGTTMKSHNAALRVMNNCQIDIVGRYYGKPNEPKSDTDMDDIENDSENTVDAIDADLDANVDNECVSETDTNENEG